MDVINLHNQLERPERSHGRSDDVPGERHREKRRTDRDNAD